MKPGDTCRPADALELREMIAQAVANSTHVEARGGGSKRTIARPGREIALLDLGAFSGVIDYEPSELVLTVRPATPLSEVEELLDANAQMLAFEPWDHAEILGTTGAATIGGVIAAGVAGPRRVSAGGARDHLLGFTAVSGRAEMFKAGGKVVKNVTGYDLSKLMAGSWGQLAIMTQLSLKVVPKPRTTATLIIRNVPPGRAVLDMARAMGSPGGPSAAAYLPARNGKQSQTVLRLEGFPQPVAVRASQLRDAIGGDVDLLAAEDSQAIWLGVRTGAAMMNADLLWRIQVAPSRAANLVEVLDEAGADWLMDWAGALVWAGAPASTDISSIAGSIGGRAMLVRAPAAAFRNCLIRRPEAPGVAALSARVKQAFDPAGILDPERFS